MEMSRRSFIGTVAALAALAVTPALAKLPQSDMGRLLAQIHRGLVEDQTFYLDAPIEIGFRVEIRRCKFVFSEKIVEQTLITLAANADGTFIHDCVFVCPNFKGPSRKLDDVVLRDGKLVTEAASL